MKAKLILLVCILGPLTACSSFEMDSRTDASQSPNLRAMNMPIKDDTCCLKFGPNGNCIQEKMAGCTRKENLNIKKK